MPFSSFRRKKSPRGQDVSVDAGAEGRRRWGSALSANSAASTSEEEERPYGIEEWVSGENPDAE